MIFSKVEDGEYHIERVPMSCHNGQVNYHWRARFAYQGRWYFLSVEPFGGCDSSEPWYRVCWRTSSLQKGVTFSDSETKHALEFRFETGSGVARFSHYRMGNTSDRTLGEEDYIDAILHEMQEKWKSIVAKKRDAEILSRAVSSTVRSGNLGDLS